MNAGTIWTVDEIQTDGDFYKWGEDTPFEDFNDRGYVKPNLF